jgi:hypothetical protein
VLRAEKRRERDLRILGEPIGGVPIPRIDGRRITDQTDAAARHETAIRIEEPIDPERDWDALTRYSHAEIMPCREFDSVELDVNCARRVK